MSVIILSVIVLVSNYIQKPIVLESGFYGTVETIEKKSKTNKLLIKVDQYRVIVYLKDTYDVEVGDYGYYEVSEFKTNNNSFNGSFNYKEFLKNKYIINTYFADDYTFIKKKFSISIIQYKISKHLQSKLKNETLEYTLTLLLGINSFEEERVEEFSSLGIVHLFIISGLHLNILIVLVSLICDSLKFTTKTKNTLLVVFILFFLLVTNFQLSILRASLMFFIALFFKNKCGNLDAIAITGILILIYKPNYLFLLSFQLTFTATFVLILTKDLYDKFGMTKTILIQSIIAFLTTLPLVINVNYEVNFASFINVLLVSVPFIYVIIPTTIIAAILQTNRLNLFFEIFDSLIKLISKVDLRFNIGYQNIFKIIIYYAIAFFLLKAVYQKSKVLLLSTIFTFLIFIGFLLTSINYTTVSFISVGQGDSSLIQLKNNSGTILIDAFDGTTKYLKSKGINTIDYVIITHFDMDHYKELEMVKNNFNVKNTIGSYYGKDDGKPKMDKYLKANDSIQISNIFIDFIAPITKSSNKNDNSLVFSVKIENFNFLFTGDISTEVEKQLLKKNINLKSDVLKVPHHGSPTSSSVEFLAAVKPTYSIFSYGIPNGYNLPNFEVMKRYDGVVFETAINGTVEFVYKDRWIIKTS